MFLFIDSHLWLAGVMVTASDLRSTGRRFDSQLFHYQVATLGKLFTHMCLCHQAVQFGTGQRAVMLCGREGLASHWPCVTDFSGLSTYGLKGYEREMSTPPTLGRGMVDFTFTFYLFRV